MIPLPCYWLLKFCSFNLIQFLGFQVIRWISLDVYSYSSSIFCSSLCWRWNFTVWSYALWRGWKGRLFSLCLALRLGSNTAKWLYPQTRCSSCFNNILCFLRKIKQKLTVSECSSVITMWVLLSAFCPPDGSTEMKSKVFLSKHLSVS